uniref:melanoma-associated antigen B2-like n=1 Tax=Jaculus jaculus TaxID=51337 RepID=UPI001E1B23F9|nr:melanoma-associated antigen B2-like [Jaculus jaculus]
MPRGKKSKAHAQERYNQNRVHRQELNDAQGRAAEDGGPPSFSALASVDGLPSTSTTGFPHKSQSPVCPTNAGTGIRLKGPGKVDQGQVTSRARSSGFLSSSEDPKYDLLKTKTEKLMEYMLIKYKMNQPLVRGEMMRVVNKSFKNHFPEILKTACQHLDMGFGLELEEEQPNANTLKLVNKLHFKDDGSDYSQLGLPTRRILFSVLSVIYLNRRCAPEEKIWLFLNNIGIYDGIPHIIIGDARKVLTQDLVQEKYLEYRQVADSNPPIYEFLWGPKAYTETCMENVLDFLHKYNEYVTCSDTPPYEDARWDEEEKGKGGSVAEGGMGSPGIFESQVSLP